MRLIEPPQEFIADGQLSLYLAGRSIGVPHWQSEAVALLADAGFDGTVLSPRPTSPGADPYLAWKPFGWQDHTIRRVDCVMFWMPIGAQRIQDLYESHLLGRTTGAVVVGCDLDHASTRNTLRSLLPWLPVESTLADTVAAALAQLSHPAIARDPAAEPAPVHLTTDQTIRSGEPAVSCPPDPNPAGQPPAGPRARASAPPRGGRS
ncbi:hypothetical protein [Kitasatospora sp. NPDC047058]|uniref:hypothetical protein n=1 Tax=Kitasatospora sp. NPDC047058 TaxID=3155620 RepID=UPI0033E0AC06